MPAFYFSFLSPCQHFVIYQEDDTLMMFFEFINERTFHH